MSQEYIGLKGFYRTLDRGKIIASYEQREYVGKNFSSIIRDAKRDGLRGVAKVIINGETSELREY